MAFQSMITDDGDRGSPQGGGSVTASVSGMGQDSAVLSVGVRVASKVTDADRLWQVPIPECYSRVVVFYLRAITGYDVWDLAIPEERLEFYGLAVRHGNEEILLNGVDGALLVEAWPSLDLPEVIRAAWQPLIDAAKGVGPKRRRPRDPGGFSARLAAEMGMRWPLPTKSRPRSQAKRDAIRRR